jgi:hypothetical protein
MTALRWKRRQSQCAAPRADILTCRTRDHRHDYCNSRGTIVSTSAERAAAGRQAIADCPEAFGELQGEGDRELVEDAASNDDNVLQALATVGELTADQTPYLGKFLAEQLFEDAAEAEYQQQLDSYRAERRTAFTDEAADLAYEATDPKHPGFLDRAGA